MCKSRCYWAIHSVMTCSIGSGDCGSLPPDYPITSFHFKLESEVFRYEWTQYSSVWNSQHLLASKTQWVVLDGPILIYFHQQKDEVWWSELLEEKSLSLAKSHFRCICRPYKESDQRFPLLDFHLFFAAWFPFCKDILNFLFRAVGVI